MSVLDVFESDAYNMRSMSTAIQRLPVQPMQLGAMGLFKSQGVDTDIIMVEELDGVLSLLPTVPRGGPATQAKRAKRKVRPFSIPHIPLEDRIMAKDVKGKRKFGSENERETVDDLVNDQMERMKRSHEVTLEYHRLGALQGKLLDADGSTVIVDLYEAFGRTEIVLNFDFSDSSTDIKNLILQVKRKMKRALGAGVVYDHLHCIAGPEWFDALTSHATVKAAFDRYQDGLFLRSDQRRGFDYAGCIFEEYDGDLGDVIFFPTDQARFFPVGVQDLFITHYAPAEYIDTVNTIGEAMYAVATVDPKKRHVDIDTEQNPLCMCTRPEALVKGTKT